MSEYRLFSKLTVTGISIFVAIWGHMLHRTHRALLTPFYNSLIRYWLTMT